MTFPSPDERDPLTGALTRAAILRLIDADLAAGNSTAVLFLDLNGFKAINDTLGHAAGDEVLAQVASRVARALPDGDALARIGGDEFVVLARGVHNPDGALGRAALVTSCFTEDFIVDEVSCRAGSSIGIALPEDGADATTMVWNADVAMYAAKRDGTGVVLFTPALREQTRRAQQRVVDLQSALDRDEMHLAYQPLIDAWSGHVSGVEALVRWNHPDGPVSPAEFIPVAERVGVIDRIGHFALTTALSDLSRWQRDEPLFAPDFVSVNVSSVQLRRPGYADTVRAALRDAGVRPHRLTLEVTESCLVTDDVTATLNELADLGVRLDVDDFGTGYSSLAYLARLPVHALKVDRSLIQGLSEDAKVRTTLRAIIRLAHDLDLKCVVEGVESAEDAAFLKTEQADLLQGYYYSKPIPAGQVIEMSRNQPMNRE